MLSTNQECPTCNMQVLMAAVHNQRNGKWTAVPLDYAPGSSKGNFEVTYRNHEAFDILGNSLGELPVAVYRGDFNSDNMYVEHPPSHYLDTHE